MNSQANHNSMDPRDRLIFALDVADCSSALRLIDQLDDEVTFYKLGLEIFLSGDYFQLLDELQRRNKKIFADLKLFDVPATVAAAVRQLDDRGIHFCTVHGQDAMLAAAAAAARQMQILAVTALTSLDQGDLDSLGFSCDIHELVLSRARRALQLGCAGVISSGLEAAALRHSCDPALLIVCPGIRPVRNDRSRADDDQKRTVDVTAAFANGADHIVVGRPIRLASDPKAAAAAIQRTIQSIFND